MNLLILQENGRAQILNIHTRKMVANGKLGSDVDLAEFATITKNFSGEDTVIIFIYINTMS